MTRKDDRSELRDLLAEQAALRRVATLVAQGIPATSIFDRVCQELGGVLGVESTDMLRFEDDRTATVVGAWDARGTPSFPVGEQVPIEGETVTGKLHRTALPQRVNDYADVAGGLAARLRAAGVRTAVGAPIIVAGQLWGAIMATSDRPHYFPAGVEQRIADFGELVTAALANADAREQLAASRARIVEAGDAARRRIERDLHDGAQQRLVSLALTLRILQGRLDEEEKAEAGHELAVARGQLDEALAELRELARGIHPSVLTDRGLDAAVQSLATRSPVPVELDVTVGERLPIAIETTAYFVVAEALANALKHAKCGCVEIRVWAADGFVFVEVGDDGVGGSDLAAGSGLRGLVDRVSAHGGTLEVDSAPGQGTTISARMPLTVSGSDGDRVDRERRFAAKVR